MRIFLHKKPIPVSQVKKMAQGGIIAIQCEDFLDFKFIDATPTMITANDFTWALLNAVETGGYSNTTGAKFIANLQRLAATVTKQPLMKDGK